MRYQQTFDGSSFQEPSPYLASQAAEVADFEQLYIDFDVYALFENTLRRHTYGRYDGNFALDLPPDDADLRPGHDYRLVDGSGRASSDGRVYLYDALHGRVVGFSKVDGSYLGQWLPAGDGRRDGRRARHVRHRGRHDQEGQAQERHAGVDHAGGDLPHHSWPSADVARHR